MKAVTDEELREILAKPGGREDAADLASHLLVARQLVRKASVRLGVAQAELDAARKVVDAAKAADIDRSVWISDEHGTSCLVDTELTKTLVAYDKVVSS